MLCILPTIEERQRDSARMLECSRTPASQWKPTAFELVKHLGPILDCHQRVAMRTPAARFHYASTTSRGLLVARDIVNSDQIGRSSNFNLME